MGKRKVRVIRVSRGVSLALLVLVSAVMLFSVYLLANSHAVERHSARELIEGLLHRNETGQLTRQTVLVSSIQLAANVLLFMPWGFFAFVVLDRPHRPVLATYLAILLGSILFGLTVSALQLLLPARITTAWDAPVYALGALAGAVLAHMRKRVRINFEI